MNFTVDQKTLLLIVFLNFKLLFFFYKQKQLFFEKKFSTCFIYNTFVAGFCSLKVLEPHQPYIQKIILSCIDFIQQILIFFTVCEYTLYEQPVFWVKLWILHFLFVIRYSSFKLYARSTHESKLKIWFLSAECEKLNNFVHVKKVVGSI